MYGIKTQNEMQKATEALLTLSDLVEKAMAASVSALKEHDLPGSRRVVEKDAAINRVRFQIEGDVIAVLATHTPDPETLRGLAAALHLSSELERMGDYAKGIAIINLHSGEDHPADQGTLALLLELEHMSGIVIDMLAQAMSAFAISDAPAARQIARWDDLVDEQYKRVYRQSMELMLAEPRHIEWLNCLLQAAHNLERMADRVTNICEYTVFVSTGERMDLGESIEELTVRRAWEELYVNK